MKRKILTLLAILTLLFSLTALYSCGGETGGNEGGSGNGGNTTEHEHSFGEYVSDGNATCTADGTKTAKCEGCEETDTVTDVGTKLGHDFGEYTSDGNATCTADGTKTAECEGCGETDTVTDEGTKLGHSYTNYIANNDATCTEDGTKTAKCDGCDETNTVTNEGSALGHSFGTPVFTWDGYASANAELICANDSNHKETAAATITSEVTKEPTSSETGTRLYTAAVILLGVTYTDTKTEELPVETAYTREGDYIFFGTYPQSAVNDSALNEALTALAGTLPTNADSQAWTSYGYYQGTSYSPGSENNTSNYMWYIDITHGGEKYRGVYFTSYRPMVTYHQSSLYNGYQSENGYRISQVYWFKYEPIKWRILTEESGKALLLCEMVIDSQEYYHSESSRTVEGSTVYANNYEYSNIRTWLNNNFYNTAFNDMQKELILLTTVDNSADTTANSGNQYVCSNTEDNIFLLSYQELSNTEYGFGSSADREKQATDYAKCQGTYSPKNGGYSGNGAWWLRSPSYYQDNNAHRVSETGTVDLNTVSVTSMGVCPALWIILE